MERKKNGTHLMKYLLMHMDHQGLALAMNESYHNYD